MPRRTEPFAFLTKKLLPWVLAAAVPVAACASRIDEENVSEVGSALTTTIGVDADAYVRSTSASTNYGSATTLLADGDDSGAVLQTYVRFTIPNVSGISSVKLRLRVTNTTSGSSTKFYEVRQVAATTWAETGLTWSNKPAQGAVISTFQSASSGTWLEIDVTSLAAPNTALSLAIIPNNITDGIDFSSKEASSNKPQIVIVSGAGTAGAGGGAGAGTAGAPAAGAPSAGSGNAGATIATDANLKIAFVGDTADGTNWGSVLSLIQAEGAQAVVVEGDMTYDADPAGWWSRTEGIVGQSYPIFLARGNHDDSSWSGFLTKAANHLGGATRTAGPHDAAYKTVFRGLSIGTIKLGDTATSVNNLFASDNYLWRVCSWHQNMAKMQVGGKGDEMGWPVYEACRQQGAIIMSGHEHTYHRTKTLTNTQTQIIDTTCSSGSSLCVGAGRTFVNVVGLGGTGIRNQVRCTPSSTTAPFPSLNTSDASCPIWAAIYTSDQGANYGAQFITFNVGGNPKKATGYFKNISGATVDTFTITHD